MLPDYKLQIQFHCLGPQVSLLTSLTTFTHSDNQTELYENIIGDKGNWKAGLGSVLPR